MGEHWQSPSPEDVGGGGGARGRGRGEGKGGREGGREGTEGSFHFLSSQDGAYIGFWNSREASLSQTHSHTMIDIYTYSFICIYICIDIYIYTITHCETACVYVYVCVCCKAMKLYNTLYHPCSAALYTVLCTGPICFA